MASKACVSRLQKEYTAFWKDPPPKIQAHPSPTNLLEWHFTIEGHEDSDYEGGVYHGKIMFPSDYPYKAPSIMMCTPNGRFAPNTQLCMSMTNFHPESWNPLWSVSSVLTGLLSFMYENAVTTGSITTSKAEKRRLAQQSLAYNCKQPIFRKLFPDWVTENERRQKERGAQQQQPEPGSAAKPGVLERAAAPTRPLPRLATSMLAVLLLAVLVLPFLK